MKGGLWMNITKKESKKDLSKNTFIVHYPEHFNFPAFDVRKQNYFSFQVHAHIAVIPEILTGKS